MKFLKRAHISTGFCLVLVWSLSACGNKGELYLPKDVQQKKTKELKSEETMSNQKENNCNEDSKKDEY